MNLDPDKLIVLFVIAMLVLGPKRLPEAARTMGRWMGEIRKYTSGFQNEFRGLLDEPQRQGSALHNEIRNAFAEPRAALEAGARDAQAAANAAGAEAAASAAPSSPTVPAPAPVVPQDTVAASLNAVPDDPTLN